MNKKELWSFLNNNGLVKGGIAGNQCICCNKMKDGVLNLGSAFKKVYICYQCFTKNDEE